MSAKSGLIQFFEDEIQALFKDIQDIFLGVFEAPYKWTFGGVWRVALPSLVV